MAKDNNRALWDYRIKHLLRAHPDSFPEATNKLVNATVPLMNSLFGSAFREWNADKGSDCKLSKWLIQSLIKIFSFLISSLIPLCWFFGGGFCLFFFWVKKLQVFLWSVLPFPTSIFTKTSWLFLRSYAPLIIPWKDLKDIKWSCLPTEIQNILPNVEQLYLKSFPSQEPSGSHKFGNWDCCSTDVPQMFNCHLCCIPSVSHTSD